MTFSVNDNDRLWREPQRKGWFQFPNPFRYILLLIILIGVIIGVWYLLPSKQQVINTNELPLIQAEATPYKVKVEDQSVPGVKHQDKLVYGRIRNDHNGPSVEHILPDPETPQAPPKEAPPPIQMVEEYAPTDMDLEKKALDSSNEDKTDKTPSVPSISSIEALIEEDVPLQKPIPKQKGKVFIQLASLKSYDLAESEAARIAKKHKDLLQEYSFTIQKVDQGAEKGIYYRIKTGPFENGEKAREACHILKERKVDCVVIP